MNDNELLREHEEKEDRRLALKEQVTLGFGVALTEEERQEFSELSDRCLELHEMVGRRAIESAIENGNRTELLEAMLPHGIEEIKADKKLVLEYTPEQAEAELETMRQGLFVRDATNEIDCLTES